MQILNFKKKKWQVPDKTFFWLDDMHFFLDFFGQTSVFGKQIDR